MSEYPFPVGTLDSQDGLSNDPYEKFFTNAQAVIRQQIYHT